MMWLDDSLVEATRSGWQLITTANDIIADPRSCGRRQRWRYVDDVLLEVLGNSTLGVNGTSLVCVRGSPPLLWTHLGASLAYAHDDASFTITLQVNPVLDIQRGLLQGGSVGVTLSPPSNQYKQAWVLSTGALMPESLPSHALQVDMSSQLRLSPLSNMPAQSWLLTSDGYIASQIDASLVLTAEITAARASVRLAPSRASPAHQWAFIACSSKAS
jgi:hypothetical protein